MAQKATAGWMALGLAALFASPVSALGSCDSRACFIDALATCEAASWQTPSSDAGRATYQIDGWENERCQLTLTYSESPNPAFVDKPLEFSLTADQLNEAHLRRVMGSCLATGGESYNCGGPLFTLLSGGR